MNTRLIQKAGGAFCVALSLSTAVYAGQAVTADGLLGTGAASCSAYLTNPKTRLLGTEWFLGYWEGFDSGSGAHTGSTLSRPEIVDRLNRLCRSSPDLPLSGAATVIWLNVHNSDR